MNKTINLPRNLVNFGIPLSLLGILVILMRSSFPARSNALDLAITIDLVLTVPMVYFLLIRKTEIPKTTVIPVMVAGLVAGSYFLPKESQTYLELFKTWLLPVVELAILAFVIAKVRDAVKKYKEAKGAAPDFFDALKNTCYNILPKRLVYPFATEIAVFYYGLINWKARAVDENEFTYHKKSGTPSLFGAFILIIAMETIALHFLLAKWSPVAAWILTGLSVYTALQVLGFARSLSQRPVSLDPSNLRLRYGIMNEAEIPYSDIEVVYLSGKPLEKNEWTKTLSPLGELESHNVVIHLRKENNLVGLYGITKRIKVIGLHLDEPSDFKEKLEHTLQRSV